MAKLVMAEAIVGMKPVELVAQTVVADLEVLAVVQLVVNIQHETVAAVPELILMSLMLALEHCTLEAAVEALVVTVAITATLVQEVLAAVVLEVDYQDKLAVTEQLTQVEAAAVLALQTVVQAVLES